MPVNNTSSCLVARAAPGSIPPSHNENALMSANSVDALTDNLKKLTVQNTTSVSASASASGATKKSSRTGDTITPADFVTLQSLRSSALAKKTNTTSKFGRDGANLFADLLAGNDEDVKVAPKPKAPAKEEKKEESKKADEAEKSVKKDEESKKENDGKETKEAEKDDDDLLSRGPVYAARVSTGFHPYDKRGAVYGIAPQSAVDDPSSYSAAYGCGYECGTQNWWNNSRELLSNSSTPDTVKSDAGYSSATSPQYPGSSQGNSPAINQADLSRMLAGDKDNSELPDALSDFILKYSRRYANPEKQERRRQGSGSDDSNCGDASPKFERPISNVGPCDSPMSAVSAPQSSPGAPHSAVSGPNTPINECFESRTGPYKLQLGQTGPEPMQRAAKDRMRRMIRDENMDEAWAWTCKCMQYFPGALCYQDTDRDTLLHIVTSHMDLAKVYALVEQMIKTEATTSSRKPYDMPNRHGETPLFLAVEKRHHEVVDYFLEAGANPNMQTLRQERDAPLHYAAARGMNAIVQTLCSYASTDVNLMNGMGLTPLLCAVRNHGVLEEESQSLINNIPTIQALLRFNADPLIPDATNGKTVIHYAVEKMDPELIEVFQAHLDEETMTTLVNKPEFCMETPMRSIQLLNVDEQTRSRLCLILLTCGASTESASQSPSYQQY